MLPNVPPSKFDEMNPSQVTETSWIYTFRKVGDYPRSTLRSGKWLVFINVKEIDIVWKKIKIATEKGLLGNETKVATAVNNPYAKNQDEKVICIKTYNIDDIDDVMRIRQELRNLGIEKKIPYKLDIKTRQNIYGVNGETKISSYFE